MDNAVILLTIIDVTEVSMMGHLIATFDNEVIMKDGVVSLELEVKSATMAGKYYANPVIIISCGAFMYMMLAMNIRSVVV